MIKQNKMEDGNINTSGIIIDCLGETWDESFVLIFPIKSIPKGMTRHGVEKESEII